jgi:2-phosphosulfolactate phosphatase
LLATQGASDVFIVAASNLSVAGERARQLLSERKDLLILCSGREGKFALEDAYAAGRLTTLALDGKRRRKGLNDAGLVVVDLARRYGENWERALTRSAAGRQLLLSTRGDDLAEATREDAYPILPVLRDRRITVEAQ